MPGNASSVEPNMSRTWRASSTDELCDPPSMRSVAYALLMTCSDCGPFTTIVPTWPSGAGRTAKISGALSGARRTFASQTASRNTARKFKAGYLFFVVDLDHEFRAAHAHDRRRRADLHRFGRLLHHLARDRREPPLP